MMAGSLSLILISLQVMSIVLANADPSGHIHRRSPQKSRAPSGGSAGKDSYTPNQGQPTKAGKSAPSGSGSRVTGGGKVTPQTPRDTAELEAWLTDKVPRVILINKTYDFTSSNTTTSGCKPFKPCANGMQTQEARNFNDWCHEQKSPTSNIAVSLTASPLNPIKVQSHKTLLGVGRSGIIKGKGLTLWRVENIIIRNIEITWLNPHVVWGGDAIMLDGAKDVWIDHCTFSLIGRQMVVSGGSSMVEGNKRISITNNLFSGKTQWSARCDGRHYWTALFSGPDDEITMARNCINFTSGRSPRTGGVGKSKVALHYYNNLHTNILGETFAIDKGSNVLAEGNYFLNVKYLHPGDGKTQVGGRSYVPLNAADASRCTAILGRPCVINELSNSSPYKFGLDIGAVTAIKAVPTFATDKVVPASSIRNGVPGRCGVGYI